MIALFFVLSNILSLAIGYRLGKSVWQKLALDLMCISRQIFLGMGLDLQDIGKMAKETERLSDLTAVGKRLREKIQNEKS